MRQVSQANEYRPGTQLAKGGRTQDVGEQPSEQVTHAREASGPDKRAHHAGLLLIGVWQLAEHFLLPSLLDHGLQLRTERWQRIMD